MQRYGEIVAIDLDKHGEEGQLSAAYAVEMQNQQHVRYVPFDFHHHCGSSNFDNMKILYDQISEDFEKQRYFLIDRQGNILEEKRGLVRLNYIDSLDRTNVTQLHDYLYVVCSVIWPRMWAEQGDEISLEYARTHALKGDLVRYGKQTITRMIKDGYLPVASALIIGGLTATTFTLQQASQNTQHYVSSVLCVVISVGVMAIVKANGRHLSSRPRLRGLL
ncbi:hypothetical protein JHK87_050810 [Glycine soja]|nr:hypothetical protein JHK87_050810 [Glycine soja]